MHGENEEGSRLQVVPIVILFVCVCVYEPSFGLSGPYTEAYSHACGYTLPLKLNF